MSTYWSTHSTTVVTGSDRRGQSRVSSCVQYRSCILVARGMLFSSHRVGHTQALVEFYLVQDAIVAKQVPFLLCGVTMIVVAATTSIALVSLSTACRCSPTLVLCFHAIPRCNICHRPPFPRESMPSCSNLWSASPSFGAFSAPATSEFAAQLKVLLLFSNAVSPFLWNTTDACA